MNSKKTLLIAVATTFILGCNSKEDMGSNPLRAKAREAENQQEQAGREQETKYGSAISDSFKKTHQ